jgi:hypothetical protein
MPQDEPPRWLDLCILSKRSGVSLLRPTASELSSAPSQARQRYAVSSEPLPKNRISRWAVDILCTGDIGFFIVDSNYSNFNEGNCNSNLRNCFGCSFRNYYDAFVFTHSSHKKYSYPNIKFLTGDTLLFCFDPVQAEEASLMVLHVRTGFVFAFEECISNQTPMYFTVNLSHTTDLDYARVKVRVLSEFEHSLFVKKS